MKKPQAFSDEIVNAISEGKGLRIRAGTQPHRFIGIWAVVVEGRVFVRSWSLKPRGWYRTFLEEPGGAIQIAGSEIPVQAAPRKSARLNDAVDRAYLGKYNAPASIRYARDLTGAKSRNTTLELVPASKPMSNARSSIQGNWIRLREAVLRLPGPNGERFAELFKHGTLSVEIYAPKGSDPQKPHTKDEVYIVIKGGGEFVSGDQRKKFGKGDFLFAPAGVAHRFENFTDDLIVWVIFYGPEGGELSVL